MNNKNNRKLFWVGAFVLCLIVVFGVYYLVISQRRISTDDAYIEGRIHIIASRISGTVKKVCVEDNQDVKKGDLLVEIDPQDYLLRVEEAKAALNAEKARLADASAGIKTSIANLQIQEIALVQAKRDIDRAQNLFKEGVITQEKFEKTQTAYDLALAQVKAAKEQLNQANALEALEESLLKQREAALNLAELYLSYSKIYASADGYITKKSVENGNQIQISQPLMSVVPLDDIWLVANYKETQLKHVLPGQKVLVKVDAYPGKMFSGKVDSIMAGSGAVFSLFPPENALGNYVKVVQRIPVKILFDKEKGRGHKLRIGMSCVPTILIQNE